MPPSLASVAEYRDLRNTYASSPVQQGEDTDAIIQMALDAATDKLHDYTGRYFFKDTSATHVYTMRARESWRGHQNFGFDLDYYGDGIAYGEHQIAIDDFATVTEVLVGGTAQVIGTDCHLIRSGGNELSDVDARTRWPVDYIAFERLLVDGTKVSVTGERGWEEVPNALKLACVEYAAFWRLTTPRAWREGGIEGNTRNVARDAAMIILSSVNEFRKVQQGGQIRSKAL